MVAAQGRGASTTELLALLRGHADSGSLRHLDVALAAFIARHDPAASPLLLVLAAWLAHMQGRGHGCLPLAVLWHGADADALPAQQALRPMLPASLDACLAALRASPVVRVLHAAAENPTPDTGQPLVLAGSDSAQPLLYLRRYWMYERSLAAHIRQRLQAPQGAIDETRARAVLQRLFPASGGMDWQKLACALALRGPLTVLTGGPGTGKTHTAARLLALLWSMAPAPQALRVALAAPTGKAAARLKQSIDAALVPVQASLGESIDLVALVQRTGKAHTLHALLGAQPDARRWAFHAARLLPVDVLLVDEASMIDLELMAALLAALPAQARLILLGDKNQLASVEAGAVLGDLCRDAHRDAYDSATRDYARRVVALAIAPPQPQPQPLPAAVAAAPNPLGALAQHTVMLRQSHRFDGPIGALAQAVNAGAARRAQQLLDAGSSAGPDSPLWGQVGDWPALLVLATRGRGPHPGYGDYTALLRQRPGGQDSAAHHAWVLEVLRAFERFRLLCAVRAGDWGVAGLNRAVEQALHAQGRIRAAGAWYAGRPVMVTRNDAPLRLFNGDIGIALPAAPASEQPGAQALRVYFHEAGGVRAVSPSRLPHVETAFAMTVHKSQGSEFAHCALVLPARAGGVASRELVYTGITRARTALSLFAQTPGLLAQAVAHPTRRASGLLRFAAD